MLLELKIKNFVIIDELIINFQKGLNILTGETGAGKSILIDALSAVLGERMTTDMIRSGFEKAVIEGSFDITGASQAAPILEESGIDCDESILVLKRELYASGKGRCFANATQIPVSKLKEISEYLIDIHGQNEHQNIVKISKHRELLDSFAGHMGDVASVRVLHATLQEIREKLNSFEIDEREKARRIEYNGHAIREIEAARLAPGEEDELKNESALLSNAEKIFREINTASDLINGDGGVIQKLKHSEQSLSVVSHYDPEASNTLESVKEALYALEDAALFLRDYEKNINYSPERINEVEERLSLISGLKKKYGATIDEVLQYAEKAARELEAINSSEEEMGRLRDQYRAALRQAKELPWRCRRNERPRPRTWRSA
jgi:DNA repair protein RecN (Recombination protein N)